MTTAPAPQPLIAVCGARAGLGKTVFAVNTAILLPPILGQPALLADADGDSEGDLAMVAGTRKGAAIYDIVDRLDRHPELADTDLRRMIGTRRDADIGVVPFLPSSSDPQRLVPADLFFPLERLRSLCGCLVADCGDASTEIGQFLLDRATAILLVATPDPMVLAHTRRFIDRLARMNFALSMVHVVLSQCERRGDRSAAERASTLLGRPILTTLRRDGETVRRSIELGRPLAMLRGALAREHRAFLTQFVEKSLHLGEPRSLGGGVDQGLDDLSPAELRRRTKQRIHEGLHRLLDLRRLKEESEGRSDAFEVLREHTEAAVRKLLDEIQPDLTNRNERARVVEEVVEEILGMGPLTAFLKDPSISEIMVNGYDCIYVEREGRIVATEAAFTDQARLRAVMEHIVEGVGRRIDAGSPTADARLPDGSRVNAVLPPVGLDGPSLTIRKFSSDLLSLQQLMGFGTLSEGMADLLRRAVAARYTVLVSGGTGSGKTTLLNVLSAHVHEAERIVTIEDSAELRLTQPHVVRLEAQPANVEGEGGVSIRDLVRNALRMRPDRIIVGECRGEEALDMLQAMNTGHDGSLTTIHANDPQAALARLETLVLFSGLELPSRAVREQIASALQLVVQVQRFTGSGMRRITDICLLRGLDSQEFVLEPLYKLRRDRDGGGQIRERFEAMPALEGFMRTLTQSHWGQVA